MTDPFDRAVQREGEIRAAEAGEHEAGTKSGDRTIHTIALVLAVIFAFAGFPLSLPVLAVAGLVYAITYSRSRRPLRALTAGALAAIVTFAIVVYGFLMPTGPVEVSGGDPGPTPIRLDDSREGFRGGEGVAEESP